MYFYRRVVEKLREMDGEKVLVKTSDECPRPLSRKKFKQLAPLSKREFPQQVGHKPRKAQDGRLVMRKGRLVKVQHSSMKFLRLMHLACVNATRVPGETTTVLDKRLKKQWRRASLLMKKI